jgi:hypothetical protein
MKKFLPAVLFIIFLSQHSNSQVTRYLVKLKNKNGTPYSFSNPLAYLSQRAIDRRTRYNIALDSTDLPCTPSYISQISSVANVTVLNVSKWQNSVTIRTSDPNAITTINGFSFVQSVSGIASRIATQGQRQKFDENFSALPGMISRGTRLMSDYYNYGTNSYNEIHLHKGEFLHNIGLRGQTMQIAMLDAGFTNYTTLMAFDSMNANNQVLGYWNFVLQNSNVNVHNHGMECLSTIAANIPGQFVGKAPKAYFYLYCTEDATSEYPIEEHNWVCGAERADSSGADVISTSLGYTTFDPPLTSLNYTYADMNGHTTISALGADQATKKGILVFAAVGNDGTNSWHYLSTPSDGDSTLAVGAVNSSGVVGSFSSYGPSSDGRVKPDVASVGVNAVLQLPNNTIGTGNGTSFATPNMAGLGTCLWQGFPEFNNMKIRSALWQAGDSANNPGNRTGYGIPDVKKAFVSLLISFSTANGSITNCKTTLNWTSKDVSAMRYEIERKAPGEIIYTKIYDVPAQAGVDILATHSYQKTDSLINVQAGIVSYRIRQIVDSALATFTAAYIDTVNIVLPSSCIVTGINPVDPNARKIFIIPNPASNQFILKVQSPNPIPSMTIQIFDMKGRTVLRFDRSKVSGVQNFILPIYRLAKGKYIVSVYDGQKLLASKELIKL